VIADDAARVRRLEALSRPSGTFGLVALDQRESLRTMLDEGGLAAEDDDIRAFKVEAARALSPLASGLLIDPQFGLDAVLDAGALANDCGLIVAADRLEQRRGEIVEASAFDLDLDLARFVALGAVALKLLVLWRRDDDDGRRVRMVEAFVAAAAHVGLLSIVEGVVRPPRDGGLGDREGDVLAAAIELGATQPDLYKAEVPTLGRGDPSEIEDRSGAISEALGCPWVVLSAGVDPDRFPASVAAACRGGASGFLAGRGVWGPSIRPGDVGRRLREEATGRFAALAGIVDEHARPWRSVLGGAREARYPEPAGVAEGQTRPT
jgi:sulfofructosephosphate aldolase